MGVVHGPGIIVDEEFVFGIASGLYVVSHVDDIAVEHYGFGIRVGKADLFFAALLQLFFFLPVIFLFRS